MGRHLSDGAWRSNMATRLLRTTTLSQRAEPSPLWLRPSPKRRIRRGTTRMSRDRCGQARRGCVSRALLARHNGGPHEGVPVVRAMLYLSEKDLARIVA